MIRPLIQMGSGIIGLKSVANPLVAGTAAMADATAHGQKFRRSECEVLIQQAGDVHWEIGISVTPAATTRGDRVTPRVSANTCRPRSIRHPLIPVQARAVSPAPDDQRKKTGRKDSRAGGEKRDRDEFDSADGNSRNRHIQRPPGCRYTPTTCFETFSFPPLAGGIAKDVPAPPDFARAPDDYSPDRARALREQIATAAARLNQLRENWLNPTNPDGSPALEAAESKKRTLTNLYNERPTWLRLAHEQLDRAVLAAYAATDPEGGWSENWAEFWTETGAGQPLPDGHPLAGRRRELDERVLVNLLRLNITRPG